MIELQWRTSLEDAEQAEVEELLAYAAAYDAEAGFSAIDPAVLRSAPPGERSRLLLVRLEAGRPEVPGRLAAVMRLVQREGDPVGEGQIVVHPDLRSRGIATLVFETIGLDPGQWDLPGMHGVRTWAFGSHPAAGRMSDRIGSAPVRQLWTVVRHLRGPFASPLPEASASGFVIEEPRGIEGSDRKLIEEVVAASRCEQSEGTRLLEQAARAGGEVTLARDTDGRCLGAVLTDEAPRLVGERQQAAIRALVVRRDSERRGISTALLASALGTLHTRGAEVATLVVDPERPTVVHLARRADLELEDVHHCFELVRD